MQKNLFFSNLLKNLAIKSDNTPHKSIYEIWEKCKGEYIDFGLKESFVENINFEEEIKPKFDHQFLPNPDYWKKQLKQKITFFLIEAKSEKYQKLLELLKDFAPNVTYFVCYGEKDVIIRFLGDEESEERLEELLINQGFQSATINTSKTILFYGREIPSKLEYKKPEILGGEVENILKSKPESVKPELILELEKSGVILNSVYFEDIHSTGRIRAFIGLQLRKFITNGQMNDIVEKILKINSKEFDRTNSRPISSIYQCDSPFMAFFIEGIFDTQEQLDNVTDAIQEIEHISDTVTMIIAKASFAPFSFTSRSAGIINEITIMNPLVQENLLPLTKKFVDNFSELDKPFINSSSDKQFQILTLFNEIVEKNEKFYSIKYQLVHDYLQGYFKGVLEGKIQDIQNIGLGYIRDSVESTHHRFIERIIKNILEDDAGKIQRTFGIGNASWEQWGLFKWGRVCYPRWNEHIVYGSILEVPQVILNDFEYLGLSRNVFAHKTDLKDIDELIYRLRDVYLRSFRLIKWLDNTYPIVENPLIPLPRFKIIISKMDKDQVQNLSGIKFDQQEIKKLILDFDQKTDSQNKKVVQMLLDIQSGIDSFDDERIDSIREMIFPLIEAKNREKANKFVDFMKDVATSIPSDVVSELVVFGLLSFLGK